MITTEAPSSITIWSRIEPYSRDPTLQDGLEARVRDPLWFLARQWQLGEFTGDDSGSPIQCSWAIDYAALSGFRGGQAGSPVSPLDLSLPLETHSERETVSLGLKGSVQLGLYFENHLLSAIPGNNGQNILGWFRQQYGIQSTPDAEEVVDSESLAYRLTVAGRVTDGNVVRTDPNAADKNYLQTHIPGVSVADATTTAEVVTTLQSYGESLYDEPEPKQVSTWNYQDLRYAFGIGAQSSLGAVDLDGSGFPGGSLDWYDFDLLEPVEDTFANVPTTTQYYASIPTHVTFRGMPNARWWTFDDRTSDLGQLVANQTDLIKLLIMEFANVYSNDWFQVPVPLPVGTLSRLSSLVVTDTFGVATIIEPANSVGSSSSSPPWGMFVMSGPGNARSDLFFLAPALSNVEESDPVEKVDFVKDDMAAIVWGVEKKLFGPMDIAVDGMESYLKRIRAIPRPDPPTPAKGTDIAYVLQTTVPYNWIPFVPQQLKSVRGSLILRRGAMPEVDSITGKLNWITPQGEILQPTGPAAGSQPGPPVKYNAYPLAPQAVPRIGTTVERSFRRARSIDGSTHVWMARRVIPGHAPGSAGLAFDEIVPTPGLPASTAPGKSP